MRHILWIFLLIGLTLQAEEEWPLMTPKPGPAPRINAPQVYGARPERPFIYRVPCSGECPLTFKADQLPPSLTLDEATGVITGPTPTKRGRYPVILRARNGYGSAERTITLVIGDQLALTPPMGWNDWYTHYDRITDELMRKAADTMVDSGMADFGYEYVNIDDCWMMKPGAKEPELGGEPRTSAGVIRPNGRFPNMKALTDYIHAKGLKAGIYTSPGHWNDPDYILIGTYGDTQGMGQPQKTKLSANEQYSYMSLWVMMAAPLFFSGDMGQLDEFTLNVLCNAEVIEVDQDALGEQAHIIRNTDEEYILARLLSDGSVAVGLFNIGEQDKLMSID